MGDLGQPLVAAPEAAANKLRRDVGFLGLGFVALGSIIGAGWLFAALYASSLAGPAALISWVLGGGAMMLLALAHAELGGTYPVAAGNARFPQYAFGRLIGFTSGWVAFLGAVTVGPIMVQATLLYASNYVSSLTTVSGGRPVLTAQGYVVAAALLLLFCVINVLGVRWLAETNMIAVVLEALRARRHGRRAARDLGARPRTSPPAGASCPSDGRACSSRLSSGGVIFACLGFEQAVQLGGESRNPGRNIPLAIIGGDGRRRRPLHRAPGGVHRGTRPVAVSRKGWSAVSFSGKAQVFGPFAGLATALGLGWLAVLLYIGRDRLAGRHRPPLHGRQRAPVVRARPERLHPGAVRPAHATRDAPLRDRVLVPLRAGALPSVPGLAAARRASSPPPPSSPTRWCRSRSGRSGARTPRGRAPSGCRRPGCWRRQRSSSRTRSCSSPAGPWSGS